MNRNLTDPTALKPSDVEAHLRLDDDGNPWRPHEPDPEPAWTDRLRAQLDAIGRRLDANTVMAMGFALGAGFVLGRILAARASS